jgi:hypothetical protein
MLYNIPIESLEERYSQQWNVWFPREFRTYLKDDFTTIHGEPLTNVIETGSFLDVCGTNYFKAGQLQEITRLCHAGMVKDGDIFFFHDLWFPGIEMLAYIRDGLGIDFKICGILHAGTYDPYDFLAQRHMGRWGHDLENAWFQIIDKIFVATQFHKDLICSSREIERHNIHVTGLPIYPDFVEDGLKRNIVVFPHRLDPEKNPERFDRLARHFINRDDWLFIKSKNVCKTKQEYYKLLNDSRIAVSYANQETWGIAQQEAVICGCVPLVPDRLSYKEMYPDCFKYQRDWGVINILGQLFNSEKELLRLETRTADLGLDFIKKGKDAIPNMIRIMEEL